MKNILMILYLIIFNCSKNLKINKFNFNNKEHTSEENNSSKEDDSKEETDLIFGTNYVFKKRKDIKVQNLVEAIISKDKVRVIKALKEGANINYKGFYSGWKHPLIFAVSNYDESIIETLLEARADISQIPIIPFIKNYILSIKFKFKIKFLEVLIKKDYIDVEAKDEENRTFMNALCYTGSYFYLRSLNKSKVLELLISKGADINTQDINGNTPLLNLVSNLVLNLVNESYYGLCLSKRINERIIEKLIKFGADINIKDKDGNTALILAAKYGETNLVEILSKSNVDINAKNNLGENALIAFAKKVIEPPYSYSYLIIKTIIGKLIKFGADTNIKDNKGNTALILAAKGNEMNLVKALLKLNANVHIKNDLGEDALITSIKETGNHPDSYISGEIIVRNLLKFGADINTKDNEGNTALILAAKYGRSGLVKILLKSNANMYIKNDLGEDALIVAVKTIGNKTIKYRKKLCVFKNLLKFASPNLTNIDSLIKELLSVIDSSYLLEKTLKIIFNNLKFLKAFICERDRLNIFRILYIQTFDIREDFKDEIVRKINTMISRFHNSSIFEDKEFLIEALSSCDVFIFKNKGLLIDTFLNIVKLYKLKEEDDVKEIKEILVNSLSDYYIDKLNNKAGYEERFLKEIEIIKSKINIFVSNLYNKIEDNITNKD